MDEKLIETLREFAEAIKQLRKDMQSLKETIPGLRHQIINLEQKAVDHDQLRRDVQSLKEALPGLRHQIVNLEQKAVGHDIAGVVDQLQQNVDVLEKQQQVLLHRVDTLEKTGTGGGGTTEPGGGGTTEPGGGGTTEPGGGGTTPTGGKPGLPDDLNSYIGNGTWASDVGRVPCFIMQMRSTQGNARIRVRQSDIPIAAERRPAMIRGWEQDRKRDFRWENKEDGEFSFKVSQRQLFLPSRNFE